MKCEKCGSEITTNICWNCGHQQTGTNNGQYTGPVPVQGAKNGAFGEDTLASKNGHSAAVRFGDWMKLDCIQFLSLIPFVGAIAALVIYIVLMCSEKTAFSIKERLKANLIWAAISVGISIVFVIIVVALVGSFAATMQNF